MKRRLGYHTEPRAGIDRASQPITHLVENDGDAFYARELVVAAATAYVKRLHTRRGD